MGYKKYPDGSTDKCLAKAFDDEMLFVLMAMDITSPEVIMEWIKLNLHKQPVEKLREAFECAMVMVDTQLGIDNTLRRQKSVKNKGLRTVYRSTTKTIGVLMTWDLSIPKNAKLYKFKNGNWKVVYDREVDDFEYIRFDFYDENPSEEMRVRIPGDGDGYTEYAFQILYDGTVHPVTHDGP